MGWPLVRLGEVAEQFSEYVTELEPRPYKKLSVKLYGRGVVLDKPADGAEVRMTRHQIASADQVIVSEIWAKRGALGVVPPEGAGALCTSHFFLFDLDQSQISVDWFRYLTVANYFEPELGSAARGTTGYASVRPKRFLDVRIPLPPLAEQQRIVARLDRVAGLVAEVKSRRAQTDADATQLLERFHFDLASSDVRPFGDFVSLSEDRVEVAPDQSYPQIGIRGFAGGLFFKEATAGLDTSYKSFNRLHPDMLVVSQPKGWEGAIAVAEDEHTGWFVSPEYRTFICREGWLLPAYLRQLVGTDWFQSELAKLTRGQGARRERLRPDMLLAMPVRMPSLSAQRKALAIHEKIQRLRAHTAPFAQDADALIPALLHQVFGAGDRAA